MTEQPAWTPAIRGRLAFLRHALAGHRVIWRTAPDDLPHCRGDIACRSCGVVLWCRAFDPWIAVRDLPPADLWGGFLIPAPVVPAPIVSSAIGQTSSPAQRAVLAQRLNHLLTLADRLPSGVSEDHVRRCVCEVVEAVGPEQDHKAVALLNSILRLQQQRQRGLRRAQQQSAPAIERLLIALYDDVVPMMEPGFFSSAPDRKDPMSEPVAVVPAVHLSQASTPSSTYSNATVAFNQESWDRWRNRGRAEDAVLDRKLQVLSIMAAVVIGVGSAFWMWR